MGDAVEGGRPARVVGRGCGLIDWELCVGEENSAAAFCGYVLIKYNNIRPRAYQAHARSELDATVVRRV